MVSLRGVHSNGNYHKNEIPMGMGFPWEWDSHENWNSFCVTNGNENWNGSNMMGMGMAHYVNKSSVLYSNMQ